MIILNLGCGAKTSSHPDVVNIDWSVMLRIRTSGWIYRAVLPLLDARRRERLSRLPDNILVHDISAGIPFGDRSVDVVYHSHMLEHLDRHEAEQFLVEVKRVLKPEGIHRIVVPDFELLASRYLDHVQACEGNEALCSEHDGFVADMIEQCVRREAYGTSRQGPARRRIENLLFGDARRRGETHQWMYDRFNLTHKLKRAGYKRVELRQFNTSAIPSWNQIGLDLDEEGGQYKKESLYLEAIA